VIYLILKLGFCGLKFFGFLHFTSVLSLAHPRGQGATGLLRLQSEIRKGHFVDTTRSKVLRGLNFRINQALKSADD
jgi:hypothetical protein